MITPNTRDAILRRLNTIEQRLGIEEAETREASQESEKVTQVEIREFNTGGMQGGIFINGSNQDIAVYSLTKEIYYLPNTVYAVIQIKKNNRPYPKYVPPEYVPPEYVAMLERPGIPGLPYFYFFMEQKDMIPFLKDLFNTPCVHQTKVVKDANDIVITIAK